MKPASQPAGQLSTLARPSGPNLGTGTLSGRNQSHETQDSVFPYDRVPGGAGHADTPWVVVRTERRGQRRQQATGAARASGPGGPDGHQGRT